jgi:hypothetical protein
VSHGTCSYVRKKKKVNSKVHFRTGHESPEGEYRYSATVSLTSALDGVGDQCHVPAALPLGKRPGTHCMYLCLCVYV